ncbi:gag-pol polyprotein, partial [Trifolium medium]|nr:gag-pol polyprotein [Trifolium medium]
MRSARFETHFVGHTCFPLIPDISFTARDGQGVTPHDDDPLVIQVQILYCDVKRVLIDSGSSTDIMYWEAFKAMQLSNEQLQP